MCRRDDDVGGGTGGRMRLRAEWTSTTVIPC